MKVILTVFTAIFDQTMTFCFTILQFGCQVYLLQNRGSLDLHVGLHYYPISIPYTDVILASVLVTLFLCPTSAHDYISRYLLTDIHVL